MLRFFRPRLLLTLDSAGFAGAVRVIAMQTLLLKVAGNEAVEYRQGFFTIISQEQVSKFEFSMRIIDETHG